MQIISKVYLRRKDQLRTYTLNKKDERMVKGGAQDDLLARVDF